MAKSLIIKIKDKRIKVCVIGLGYVGFPLLDLISGKGFTCIGLDVDEKKIDHAIKAGLNATLDPRIALDDSDCIIICVPTPIDENYRPDLNFVKSASETITNHLKKDSLIILESTVAPGTTEEVVVSILEKSGLKLENDFYVAHCPERIDPGNKKWTVKNIPRVIGGVNEESTNIAHAFYKEILDADIVKLSTVKAAEAVKIVENTFRDINIAFVNELAKSFDKIDIDVMEVIKGASTKPFGFMPHYPGCGIGGHCIAVDPYYLIENAEKNGFNHRFLKLAREINNSMPEYTVQKVILGLNKAGMCIKDTNISVLGLAYKGGVDDTRESPAFPIIALLEKLGANLTIFDPFILNQSTVKTLGEALGKNDCIVIVTDHPEYKKLSAEVLKENGIKVVIDGRNILNKEQIRKTGIIYLGIGN